MKPARKLKCIKPRRRLYAADETERVNVYLPKKLRRDIEKFQQEVKHFSGQTVTLAYLFREGARSEMRKIRNQMGKAQSGVYHAKPRKDSYPGLFPLEKN